jgi:hypothetical protein
VDWASDFDGDGVPDAVDPVPDDPAYPTDSDGDGVGDDQDTNDKNDRICMDKDQDGCDDCRSRFFDPSDDGRDTDGNGLCDTCDTTLCNGGGTCFVSGSVVACECDEFSSGTFCDECAEGYQDNDGNGSCTYSCETVGCTEGLGCDDSTGVAICCADADYDGLVDCPDVDACPGSEGPTYANGCEQQRVSIASVVNRPYNDCWISCCGYNGWFGSTEVTLGDATFTVQPEGATNHGIAVGGNGPNTVDVQIDEYFSRMHVLAASGWSNCSWVWDLTIHYADATTAAVTITGIEWGYTCADPRVGLGSYSAYARYFDNPNPSKQVDYITIEDNGAQIYVMGMTMER